MPEGAPGENAGDVTEDALLGGALRLLQPRRGHRAGTDAVLLAAASGAQAGDTVVDLGSASGVVGLMTAIRVPGANVILAERDPALVGLAIHNIGLNDLRLRVKAVEVDVFGTAASRADAGLPASRADLVLTNPPFFAAGTGHLSPEPGRRAAHAMAGGDLPGWIATAAALLRPGGRLVMIHRADRLAACLDALKRRCGAVTIRPIHPRRDAAANRILVAGTKGSRAPLALAPALVLHEDDGRFTPEAAALHRLP